jgi:hypothetical protein
MRLLNTKSLKLETFLRPANRPPYAILSHTWGSDEVTLQQISRPDDIRSHGGYTKIVSACEVALKRGLSHIWIDTICIDKTNSSELAEAIKLMFQWYQDSEICLAYLVDVYEASASKGAGAYQFSNSRWFTRGWTLQELIAPSSVDFFNSDWVRIGTRDDLAADISAITRISQVYLTAVPEDLFPSDSYYLNFSPRQLFALDRARGEFSRRQLILSAPVAERMSWASSRETTKEEDMAYCLLGIFDVNIPLLYGEGGQAFQRLQMEILQHRFDPTLLAWNLIKDREPIMPVESSSDGRWTSAFKTLAGQQHPWYIDPKAARESEKLGYSTRYEPQVSPSLLASGPEAFNGSEEVDFLQTGTVWSVTTSQLQVALPKSLGPQQYILVPCHKRDDVHRLLAIPVFKQRSGIYVREFYASIWVDSICWDLWPHELITIEVGPRSFFAEHLETTHVLRILPLPDGFRCTEILVGQQWQPYAPVVKIRQFQASQYYEIRVAVLVENPDTGESFASIITALSKPSWRSFMLIGFLDNLLRRLFPLLTDFGYMFEASKTRVESAMKYPNLLRGLPRWGQARGKPIVLSVQEESYFGSTILVVDVMKSPGRFNIFLAKLRSKLRVNNALWLGDWAAVAAPALEFFTVLICFAYTVVFLAKPTASIAGSLRHDHESNTGYHLAIVRLLKDVLYDHGWDLDIALLLYFLSPALLYGCPQLSKPAHRHAWKLLPLWLMKPDWAPPEMKGVLRLILRAVLVGQYFSTYPDPSKNIQTPTHEIWKHPIALAYLWYPLMDLMIWCFSEAVGVLRGYMPSLFT